jgi:U2 small nuclear ribonucleoprotein B''
MPIAAGGEVTATELQQSIFGAPPSSLPAPVKPQMPEAMANEHREVHKEDEPKGAKRAREEESDEEGAPMEEDSDAPMEASSDEDSD